MAEVWTDVRSSNVKRAGWDDEAQEVLVEFKSGAVYAYPDQGESVYQDLITSQSPGAYVARWLRDKPARRIA